MTEIGTDQGKLFLATVIDLFSRRLLGYAMSDHHDADLVVASLRMAATTRAGTVDGMIFHSDRGSEGGFQAYETACRRLGVLQSMGRVGSALDNAAAESFNSTVKVEYIHRHWFTTRAEARLKISTWIVDFYNLRRRHSTCDGMVWLVEELELNGELVHRQPSPEVGRVGRDTIGPKADPMTTAGAGAPGPPPTRRTTTPMSRSPDTGPNRRESTLNAGWSPTTTYRSGGTTAP
jgi:hypothetical protein